MVRDSAFRNLVASSGPSTKLSPTYYSRVSHPYLSAIRMCVFLSTNFSFVDFRISVATSILPNFRYSSTSSNSLILRWLNSNRVLHPVYLKLVDSSGLLRTQVFPQFCDSLLQFLSHIRPLVMERVFQSTCE